LRRAITSPDGNIYYMPAFDASRPERNFQVMWLNQSWLKTLKLKLPQTTAELRDVLRAFRDGDPNGNGKPDEIPLSGSFDVPSEQCFNFIINAFVYNDPANSRLFVDNGAVRFAPVTDEWREAMKYLGGLYAEGLISPFQFELGHSGLAALANDPWDILGGFASASITDVIFPGNIDVANSFVHITPLADADGTRRATARTQLPKPGGVITASCENPEMVFKLLDLMMSEEAFVIGRYGEENVDWVPGDFADLDFYGNAATVRVINQLHSRTQNKTLGGYGPFFAYPAYADGATFSVRDVDPQYIDARAYRAYGRYKPEEHIRTLPFNGARDEQARRQAVDSYTDESIRAFVTGAKDPFDDSDWAAHIAKYQELEIEKLIDAARERLP
jgi:putative aldouronate transport system substrate-binding protein